MNPDIARLYLDHEAPPEPVQRTNVISHNQPWQYSGYPRSRDITKEFNHASAGKAIFGCLYISQSRKTRRLFCRDVFLRPVEKVS